MKSFIALTLILLSSAFAKADPPTHHGMLIFGDKQTYASHLPMFHGLHAYQLIMSVEFDKKTSDQTTLSLYAQAKKDGKTLFTIFPESMDLTKIMNGEIKNFSAKLFDGHFERGGAPLGQVMVSIKELIVSHEIGDMHEPSAFSEYVLFGKNGEYYVTHKILDGPSFDYVAKVTSMHEKTPGRNPDKDILIPISDNQLPMTVFAKKVSPIETSKIPQKGQTIEGAGTKVGVGEVIYQEIDELKVHHH